MKKIAVLGVTGSIGQSTLEVIREHRDAFDIVFASAHSNARKLFDAAADFSIQKLALADATLKSQSLSAPKGSSLVFGTDAMLAELAETDCDIVVNAISGSAGLCGSIVAINKGIDLALANKESLVMAGAVIREKLQNSDSAMLPIDSEHSAIMQCLENSNINAVRKLIITASGGPFRTLPLEDFETITLKEALKHPTWSMGSKITIDSATMMNKALEVIEAHWLFDLPFDSIRAVIHPQSIIHSMVEYKDGSILSQMGTPSMKLPILYALAWPERFESEISQSEVLEFPNLSFHRIERERYPLYFLGCEAGKEGGLLPTVLNAANEAAVHLFSEAKISFTDIYRTVRREVDEFTNISSPDLETIIETNRSVYQSIISRCKQ